ncbi:hypothetical protein CVIRNUC_009011 [Coccomyxa viridis]|uniref:SET domain-containing protein n=1 Tax=Coccomyxa viridis TaxID=1274662 RepID=A0AAV1IH70_9CHLO|nr:hypothetical protein CVIRNUC_009011 [Coccomyxa viridis]
MVEWVRENGGSVSDAVSISYPNAVAGAGLQASRACKAGERLVNLPAHCQLTYGEHTTPELMRLIEKVPQEFWGAKLALQILQERTLGTASFFRHYISNLPVAVPGIPLFYTQEAVKALEEYPPLSQQVKKRCRWLLTFAEGELAELPGRPDDPFGGQRIDGNTLGWALAMSTSRAFRVRGAEQPAAQLPLIDMCNHSFAPNCQVFPGKEGSVDLVASRNIQASEDLLLSYGNLDNDFLLLDYGFLVPSNPFDAVAVRFDVAFFQAANALSKQNTANKDDVDTVENFQESLLSELSLAGPEADRELMLRRSLPSCSPRALAAARILCAGDEAELAGRTADALGRWRDPVSPINEVKALRMIAGVAFFVLSRFPKTLEQDKQLLAGQSLPDDLSLAVQLRLAKKQIMAQLLHDLASRIKELAMQPVQQTVAPPHERSSTGKREYSTIACRGRHDCRHPVNIGVRSSPWGRPGRSALHSMYAVIAMVIAMQ